MRNRERLVIALLCAVVLLAPPVVAQTEVGVPGGRITETADIPAGEWKAYRIAIAAFDSLAFSARVTSGGVIDVYILSSTGYGQYRDPVAERFQYEHATERTSEVGTTVSPSPAGTFYLVLDNALISGSGADGSGPVTVSMSAEVRPFPILIAALGGVAVLAIIILLIALVVRRRRKRRAMMPAMAPMQPPMQPPYPPPYQPPSQPPSNPPPGP